MRQEEEALCGRRCTSSFQKDAQGWLVEKGTAMVSTDGQLDRPCHHPGDKPPDTEVSDYLN